MRPIALIRNFVLKPTSSYAGNRKAEAQENGDIGSLRAKPSAAKH